MLLKRRNRSSSLFILHSLADLEEREREKENRRKDEIEDVGIQERKLDCSGNLDSLKRKEKEQKNREKPVAKSNEKSGVYRQTDKRRDRQEKAISLPSSFREHISLFYQRKSFLLLAFL
ncbi:hypothetical protein CSUI_005232 [Cystoisospora suis]|uniref:Uncharacterized protein n=1 Tax=Cystoisospora suis TaxID=483139 RepID=A0A2C6KVY2_9APIC|nr:hypothetical protein CSUI_005232 [Cystoisospora suis]